MEGWFFRLIFRRAAAVMVAGHLLFLHATDLQAQILPFEHYTTRDGLVSNAIKCLTQDSFGYLWIGTTEGISVFDGTAFKNYTIADGLPNGNVNWIVESRTSPGMMWIATNGGGICRLHGGAISVVRLGRSIPQNAVNRIEEDLDGTLWCATDDGLFTIKRGMVQPFAPESSWYAVQSVLIVRDSVVLFETLSKIVSYDTRRQAFRSLALPLKDSSTLLRMEAVGDSNVWVTGMRGQLFQVKNWRLEKTIDLKVHEHTHTMARDRDGNLWLGMSTGCIRIPSGATSPDAFTIFTNDNGLLEPGTTAVCQDREGNYWFGTWSKGLSKLSSPHIVKFPVSARWPKNAGAVLADTNHHLWVSLQEGFLELWRRPAGGWESASHRVSVAPLVVSPRSALYDAERHGIWMEVQGQRLVHCRIRSHPGAASSLEVDRMLIGGRDYPKGALSCLLADHRSRLYCAIGNVGVTVIAPWNTGQPGRLYDGREIPFAQNVRAMCIDRSGNLWLGEFSKGVARLEHPDSAFPVITTYTAANGLADNNVRDIFEDHHGRIWVGTRYGGLSVIDENSTRSLTVKEGLLSNCVWSIAEDDRGTIWLGTQSGLQSLTLDSAETFTTIEELRGSVGIYCGVTDDRIVWASSPEDVTVIDTKNARPAGPPPPVYIVSLKINGETARLGEDLTLSADQSNLAVEFIGVSFASRGGLRYRFLLEGVDDRWRPPTRDRLLSLVALSPGKYRLSVKAISSGGVESSTPAVLAFTILPPLWQRWWFILLSGAGMGIAAWSLHRYRINRAIEIERVRSRIASDLHDDLGADLTQIAVLSDVILSRIAAGDTRVLLEKIGSSARRIIDGMSDLVWYIDPRHDTVQDLVHRIYDFAGELLQAQQIAFSVNVDPAVASVELPPESRKEVMLIIKEGLNNAVRHAQCSSISMAVHLDGRYLSVELRDDGHGMPEDAEGDGHGVLNMRRRALALGGMFAVNTSPSAGTSLHIRIPLSRRRARATRMSS